MEKKERNKKQECSKGEARRQRNILQNRKNKKVEQQQDKDNFQQRVQKGI